MPSEGSPSNVFTREDRSDDTVNNNETAEPPNKRRRVFLQTMGQQLREVGAQGDGPEEIPSSIFVDEPRRVAVAQSSSERPMTAGTPASGRQVHIQTPESDAVPGENDELSTGATFTASKVLWHSGEVLVVAMPSMDNSNSFTFDDLIAWTSSYFDYWHPAYPFLHAPSILEYFDQVVDHGTGVVSDASPHQLTILRSLMSISLADRRQTGTAMKPVPSQLIFASFNDAIHSVQCLLTDESSILALQAVVSVQLFLISMLRYNAASRLEGLAVRMAYHLGLHRCPSQLSNFPDQEAELRRRLFWSMYCIDRYICIRLGIPLAIRDAEVNVCLPSWERHGDRTQAQSDNDGRLDLLEFLTRHAAIRGSITEIRNRSVSDGQTESDEIVGISTELTKWWNEIEEYFESNDSASLPINRHHQVTLSVLRHESVIALNKHTLATSKKTSAYDAALHNCIGASRSIISTLHRELENNITTQHPESDEGHALFWPSFTWAVWMSAFLIIYAANDDQIPQDVAIRLADRALEILKHLTIRGSVWPKACGAAIRDLRGRLIEKRNRSKHTSGNTPKKSAQNSNTEQTPSREANTTDTQFGANTSSRLQYRRLSLAKDKQTAFQTRQGPPSGREAVSTRGNDHDQTFTFDMPSSSNFADAVQLPFMNRVNGMFSGFGPGSGAIGSSGNAQRMSGHLGLEPQTPYFEGSELLYGLDIPFWMNDGQWTGLGG